LILFFREKSKKDPVLIVHGEYPVMDAAIPILMNPPEENR
jgi:hypothetical protein